MSQRAWWEGCCLLLCSSDYYRWPEGLGAVLARGEKGKDAHVEQEVREQVDSRASRTEDGHLCQLDGAEAEPVHQIAWRSEMPVNWTLAAAERLGKVLPDDQLYKAVQQWLFVRARAHCEQSQRKAAVVDEEECEVPNVDDGRSLESVEHDVDGAAVEPLGERHRAPLSARHSFHVARSRHLALS